MPNLGRPPAKPRLGTKLLIRVAGIDYEPLLAEVVRNAHRLVVKVVQPDPIFAGCRLNESQFSVVRMEGTA